MTTAVLPADEELRLRTLYAYQILDTMEERAFDDICQLAASVCDTPISLCTLLDRRRQWFKSRVGLSMRETERDCSFCAHAILQGDLMMVEDATQDARFLDNRLVLSAPHIRFYAGVPLRAHNGQPLGSICVIDRQPRRLDGWQKDALHALAHQAEAQLELRRGQHDKDLLGRFLVHDMRNPLTSMLVGLGMAIQDAHDDNLRVTDLIDVRHAGEQLKRRVEDFHSLLASEHGALPLRVEPVDLAELVEHVQRSAKHQLAERELRLESALDVQTVRGDVELLRRVLENLVYNALPVAPRTTAIRIETWTEGAQDVLIVADEGPGIPKDDQEAIFQIYRTGTTSSRASTGLGLAFCDMAVRAMGGRIRYDGTESKGAVFRVELPRSPREGD